jgi:hypothetical protein
MLDEQEDIMKAWFMFKICALSFLIPQHRACCRVDIDDPPIKFSDKNAVT